MFSYVDVFILPVRDMFILDMFNHDKVSNTLKIQSQKHYDIHSLIMRLILSLLFQRQSLNYVWAADPQNYIDGGLHNVATGSMWSRYQASINVID